jgi:hypothetical protein
MKTDGRYTYLERSLGLLSAGDQELLEKSALPVISDRYEFGYWVFVDHEAIDEDRENVRSEFARGGYSDEFFRLILNGREADCWWIRFDRDAPSTSSFSEDARQKQTLHVG